MGVLPDWIIKDKVSIAPMALHAHRPGKISYGITSYGYDARLGYKFKVFSPINATEIDPKNFDKNIMVDVEAPKEEGKNYILIPPHSFALAETLEWFTIPRNVLAVVLGKSTYARTGLIVNVTPLEPEFSGKVTVELSNTTPLPIRVYAREGIMQVLFIQSSGYTDTLMRTVEALLDKYLGVKNTDDGFILERIKEAFQKDILHNVDCVVSYADKKGKYQNQTGIEIPIVKKD